MSVCSVGPRFGGAAVRIGACRKAEAVSPKANPPSGISKTEGGRTNPTRATPKRCVPKSGSREPEGQPAQRPLRSGACRKSEVVNPKANSPSGNPEAVRAEKRKRKVEELTRRAAISETGARRPTRRAATTKQKAEAPTRRGQPRSGACRKAEAVSPKANPPRATPKRCVPKSGSREPEGQPAERQPRSGACRKAEAVSPKVNPPSGNLRNGRSPRAAKTTGAPSGENRRSKPRNEGSAEQCRHTYQYNRKTRL